MEAAALWHPANAAAKVSLMLESRVNKDNESSLLPPGKDSNPLIDAYFIHSTLELK